MQETKTLSVKAYGDLVEVDLEQQEVQGAQGSVVSSVLGEGKDITISLCQVPRASAAKDPAARAKFVAIGMESE